MLALLASSVILFLMILSMGTAFSKVMRLGAGVWDSLFLGIAVLNTLCAWVSLVLPIGFTLMVACLVCSFGLLALSAKDIRAWIGRVPSAWMHATALLFLVIVAFIVASGRPMNWDTLLYHLPTIQWYETYPVVPGLANLHGPLAYNQNVFLLYALTSLKKVFGREVFSVNFLVFAVFMGYLTRRLRDMHRRDGVTWEWLFYLMMAILVIRMPNLSSPSPDFVSQVLPIYITLRMLDIFRESRQADPGGMRVLFLLGCYCITVKLTSAPIMALFVIFELMRIGPGIRSYLPVLPMAGLIVVPWLMRFVVMSGWLVYPFPSLDLFSFDWKAPYPSVVHQKDAVTVWARVPMPGLFEESIGKGISHWFPLWLKYGKNTPLQLAMMAMGFLLPFAGLVGMGAGWFARRKHVMALLIISIVGMQFWFWTGPAYRMGVCVISVSALSPLLFLPRRSFGSFGKPGGLALAQAYGLLALSMTLIHSDQIRNLFNGSYRETGQFLIPPRMHYKKPDMLKMKGTNFEYYYPSPDIGCYDFGFPCTPFIDSTLTMRGSTFREGFRKISPDKSGSETLQVVGPQQTTPQRSRR